MHREPYRRLILGRPFHAMPNMRLDVHMVAGLHDARRILTLEPQSRRTAQHHHPFGTILIEPFSGWRGLAGRNDSFDPQRRRLQEVEKRLAIRCRSDAVVNVVIHVRHSV